jgi:acyl carrier protein
MTRTETLEFLITAIKKVSPAATSITEDSVLADIGLNSLDIVELQMFYEDATNTQVADPTVPLITVKDLLDLINQ